MNEDSSSQDQSAEGIVGVVGKRPICFWVFDPLETQSRFLKGFNPTYFEFNAEILLQQLAGENRHIAALSIRSIYSHALETLFALIGAVIQCPHCVPGWLLAYESRELRQIISDIDEGHSIYNDWELRTFSWKSLSEAIFKVNLGEWDGTQFQSHMAHLLSCFAEDFLENRFLLEYNSVKHGFRVHPEEFLFSIGVEDKAGVPAPPERMRLMNRSDFGSNFPYLAKIDNHPDHKVIAQQRLNWDPELLAELVRVISVCLSNLISILKLSTEGGAQEFKRLNEDTFRELWKKHRAVTAFKFSLGPHVDLSKTELPTKRELLNHYLKSDVQTVEGTSDL